MSFRDLIDRITGRKRSGQHFGRVRSRSEPTIQLPKPGRDPMATPAAPGHAITSPENRLDRAPRPHAKAAPVVSRPAAASAPLEEAGATPDATTVYHLTADYSKDEVTGVLIAIDGELKGEVFKLFHGENKLGRARASDVVLSSKWISREHAMVVNQDGVFAIIPLTEKNRTHVNDREVDGAELLDGDTIRLGHTTFRFRSVEGL